MTPELPKRICFLTYSCFPRLGGVEKHLRCLCEELSLSDAIESIDVLTIGAPGESYDVDIPKVRIHVVKDVRTVRNRFVRKLMGLWVLLPHFRNLWRADVIHFHDYAMYWDYFIGLRPFFSRSKLYVTFHGFEGDVPPKKSIVRRRQQLERSVAGSLEVGDFISKWYGTHPSRVIYGAASALNDRLDAAPANNRCVYIGRIAPDTEVSGYIEALSILQQYYGVTLALDLYGYGSDVERVLERARSCGVEADYRGALETEAGEVYAQYRYAFCSGYLSLWEAAAAGCLIYCYYTSELKRDYFTYRTPFAEHIISSDSPHMLAKVLSADLKSEPSQRREALQALARTMTWTKVSKEYQALWT